MATFTTWQAYRTAILNAMQDAAENRPWLKSYHMGSFGREVSDPRELPEIYKESFELEALSDTSISNRISYGRPRRFD